MRLTNQPTRKPTNKLTAAVLTAAVVQTTGWVVFWFFEEYGILPAALSVPVGLLAAFVIGYVVRDQVNVKTSTSKHQ